MRVVIIILYLLTVASYCESSSSSTDISNRDSASSRQYQHEQKQQESHPSSPSSSPNGPRLIGLNINGMVNCLLWSNPKTSVQPSTTLIPLFSSPEEDDDEDEDYINSNTGHNYKNYSPAETESTKDDGEKPKQQQKRQRQARLLQPSVLLPGAVFATTDYRFRKERWYGVERIGMIFRWNLPWSSSSREYNNHLGNNNKDLEEKDESIPYNSRKIFTSLPTTVDVTARRYLFSTTSTKADRNNRSSSSNAFFTSFVDSGSLRVGWQTQNEENNNGQGSRETNNNPWIQIGFDPSRGDDAIIENDDVLAMNNRGNGNSNGQQPKHPFHLRFFLPLIRRRLDLRWTSRWGNGNGGVLGDNAVATEKDVGRESSYRLPSDDDPWWMPRVGLDPSTGTLSSDNRYRNAFEGRDDRRYATEFKLRLRTTMPTILSSVTNNPLNDDDDDDQQVASLRLDCSLMTDLGTARNRQSRGFTTATTACFETIVVPSFWLRSVIETARFGLFHEQNHRDVSN